MRNASILALGAFLLAWRGLAVGHGNRGLWLAFILYVAARALALAAYYPGLRAGIGLQPPRPAAFLDATPDGS
jgi:MATE family multidrug resistance protein